MKNILLITLLFSLFTSVQAQNKTVTDDIFLANVLNASNDTIQKNDSIFYSIYVKPFIDVVKWQTTATRVSGSYSKAMVILQTSFDYVNWVNNDTLLIAGAGITTQALTSAITIKDPYFRLLTVAYDSTATLKIKHNILIDTNK